MTPDAALFQYFNGFMQSFPVTAVPDDAVLPWMTYEYVEGNIYDGPATISANMWFRTESEAVPNIKAREFRRYIKEHGLVRCDDGLIWIKPGNPWSQAIREEDSGIKRRYINLEIEFFTR